MKRVVVWPIPVNERAHISCSKCRAIMGPFVLVDVPIMCLYLPFMGHLWEVVGLINRRWLLDSSSWEAWGVLGQPLCGAEAMGSYYYKKPPYEFMWAWRLLECTKPEDRRDLRGTLMMAALNGGYVPSGHLLPAKGSSGL